MWNLSYWKLPAFAVERGILVTNDKWWDYLGMKVYFCRREVWFNWIDFFFSVLCHSTQCVSYQTAFCEKMAWAQRLPTHVRIFVILHLLPVCYKSASVWRIPHPALNVWGTGQTSATGIQWNWLVVSLCRTCATWCLGVRGLTDFHKI